MRILLVTDDLRCGGAERQFALLAASLKKAGNEVRVITFYDSPVFYDNILVSNNIKTEVYTRGINPLRRILFLKKLFKEWNPNAVIAFKDGCAMASILAAGRKTKVTVSERNNTVKLTLRQRIKFFLYRYAGNIVSNSSSQKNFIARNFPHLDSKTSVIHNFLSFPLLSSSFEKSRPFAPSDNECFRLLTAGRVAPQKNPEKLIDAMKILKREGFPVKLLWIGESVDEVYRERILRYAENEDVSDIITFRRETSDIAAVYADADLFILPSLFEGFSNALCEAMYSSLPAIASSAGDNQLILGNPDRIFNPENACSISEAIKKMILLSPEERASEGKRNHLMVKGLTSQKDFTDKWLNVISTH